MTQFPKTVLGFYARNFWRYGGVFVLLFSFFSIINVSIRYLSSSFFVQKIISVFETTPMSMVLSVVIPIVIVFFILQTAQLGAGILRWYLMTIGVRYKAYNKISADLYDYVFRQSVEFYSNSMPGKIGSQIDKVASSFNETMIVIFDRFLSVVASILIASLGLVFIGWEYMVIIIAASLFRVLWSLARTKRILKSRSIRAQKTNNLQGSLLDALSNFVTVKLFARAPYEQDIAKPMRRATYLADRDSHFQSRLSWAPTSWFADVLCFSALFLLCGYKFSTGESSIADVSFAVSIFVAIGTLSQSLAETFRDFADRWGDAVGSYNSLIKPITIVDAPNAPKLQVSRGTIEFQNVCFKYNKKLILDNLSMTIKPGEKVGLVGLSGAGKTTLVNLLMRLYEPGRGQILIDGTDIRTVTQDSLRENIAFIPQEPTMFNRTLRENIGYGKIDATNTEIRRAAKLASADQFIANTPKKYETLVGDRGIKLSGGQRQRVAIARAFLKDAPILILDEATAALDSETENVIQKSFDELSRGRTTLAIAHRLSTLRNMDRIIVMDDGRIVESGTHNTLVRKRGGIYARLWKMQSGGFIQE